MISLHTGLPGSGKTLFLLTWIKDRAEREGRPVFYHGINQLTLPWTLINPKEWMECPHGAIIVIDECQDTFPAVANGAKREEFIMQLAKHRHKGFDIVLVTPNVGLVDSFVRKLVNQHYHSVRKFGFERSSIYEWDKAQPIPEGATAQKLAVTTLRWKFNKEAYNWYKSAEAHTMKRRVPMKIILVALFVIAMVGVGYWSLTRYQSRVSDVPGQTSDAAAGLAPGSVAAGGASAPFDPVADATNFVQRATPRVAGLAFTAPKYDKITEPTSVPVPAMCVQIGSVRDDKPTDCRCYSQQATKLDVPFNMCIEFARNGFFREFDPDNDKRVQDRSEASVSALSRVPDQPLSVGRQWTSLASADTSSLRAPEQPRQPDMKERTAQVHNGSIYPSR